MTCYFRHLGEVFKKAGIEVTPQNKKQLDRVIHELVKTTYKDCASTWREVKKQINVDQDAFASQLKVKWNSLESGAN